VALLGIFNIQNSATFLWQVIAKAVHASIHMTLLLGAIDVLDAKKNL
jgi:hypothetical protein